MKKLVFTLGLCLLMVGCDNQQNDSNTENTYNKKQAVTSLSNKEEKNSLLKKQINKNQTEISQAFIDWASTYAKEHKQALSQIYFDHGASSGDWFAITPDGLALVQIQTEENEQNNQENFPINIIGGFTLYTSKAGLTGKTTEVEEHYQTADGFAPVADKKQPITKYIMADNGSVYEYNSSTSFTDGFNITDDNGKSVLTSDNPAFIKVKDAAIQTAYEKIIAQTK